MLVKDDIQTKIIIGVGLALFLIGDVSLFSVWNLTGGSSLTTKINPMLIVAILTSLSGVLICGVFILLLRSHLMQVRSKTQCNRTVAELDALQLSAQHFFNLSLELLSISNLEGYFTHLNPAWEKNLGFNLDQLKHQPFITFVHPDDVEATQLEMKKLEAGISSVSFENRYRRKDGSYQWLSWVAIPYLEKGCIYGIAHDISKYKEIESALQKTNDELEIRVAERTAALRQTNDELVTEIVEHRQIELALLKSAAELANSEERFRTCIENMLDCFGIYRAIRDESGKIIDFAIEYVNAAACKNNQMTKQEQMNQRLCELLPSHYTSGLFEEYCQLVETGQPLLKESIDYEDNYKGQNVSRAFNICAVKLGDGFACAWRDVTERMQAEEALRDSEERLRTALEAASMGTWDWDILTGEIVVSDSFEFALDIASNCLKDNYQSFITKIHADDRDRVLHRVEWVLQAGGDYKDEFRILLPNGNICWFASRGRVFYDERGKPVRMTGIALDVTERKEIEEARRRTQELYRTITKNFPNGAVMLFNHDLCYTLAEGQGLVEVGLSKELMEGKTIWEILSSETCEFLEPYYRAALEGSTSLLEVPYKDKTFLVHVLPVKNEQGEILAGMVMTQNITQRKRAELALMEERNFIAAILDTANALIIVLDEQGRIVRFNRACEQVTGYSFAEVKTQYFWDFLLLSEEVESVKAVFHDLLSGQYPSEYENYWVAKDGTQRLLSWSNTLLHDIDGSVKYVIGIGIDITDRKQAEEMRRALEREQELSELRFRFFAMASHEFRTPLSTILLTAQLLNSSVQEWSLEKSQRNLKRIESAAKTMRQILDDILTINRVETGKLDFNPISLNVEQFCRYLLEEMRRRANPEHSLTLISKLSKQQMCLDEKIFRCILTHLLSNAIKYSPQGGEIKLVLSATGEEIQVQVCDRGIGIPLSDQPHLFEAFHRGENIEGISGSGLGLTVVKKCVELHRGRITFTSEVGIGTTFTVALPTI